MSVCQKAPILRGFGLVCLLNGDGLPRLVRKFELEHSLREIDRAGRALSALRRKPPGNREQLLQNVPVQSSAAPVEHESGLFFPQRLRKALFQLLRLRE